MDLERQRSKPRIGTRGLPAQLVALLYLAFLAFPLVMAILDGEKASIWREIASAAGALGFAILLSEFVLSGRFTLVSGRIGIDAIMRLHQLAARVALVLIVLHPLLYVWPRMASDPMGAASMLGAMFASGSLRTGVIAWALTIILVAMAIWRDQLRITYETWRLSHGLGALLIAAFSLHHALAIGSHSVMPALALYWQAGFTLALLTMLHVYILRPLLQMRAPYRIASVEKAAERTWLLVIEPQQAEAITFEAGQFVWLNIGHSPFSLTEHPFSIASAPHLGRLDFLIKEAGDFTNKIGAVKPGTRVWIDGPYGHFTLPEAGSAPLVFIAGGVGIAPVLSMLREMDRRRTGQPVTLIYGNRLASQIVAPDELRAMETSLGLHLQLVLGEPPEDWRGLSGDLSEPVLRPLLTPLVPDARYMICGPLPMIDAVEAILKRLGISSASIFTERFRY
jgi:predicted ferric reductase